MQQHTHHFAQHMMMTMAMTEITVSPQWNGLFQHFKVLKILPFDYKTYRCGCGAVSTRLGAPPIEQRLKFRYHDDRALLKLLKTITLSILNQYPCIIYQNHCLITDNERTKFISAL
jgi:hypothetical protein